MSAAAASAPGEPAAAGWVLLLPALVVLWNEVRGRGATLIGIGVWGTVLGVLGYVGGSVLNLVTRAVAPSAQGLEAFTRIQDDGLLVGVVVLPIQLGLVALVVLLAGVARARLGR